VQGLDDTHSLALHERDEAHRCDPEQGVDRRDLLQEDIIRRDGTGGRHPYSVRQTNGTSRSFQQGTKKDETEVRMAAKKQAARVRFRSFRRLTAQPKTRTAHYPYFE